ncbi:MAG: S-layer homology domain-containing protein [Eubacteriales bacterium]
MGQKWMILAVLAAVLCCTAMGIAGEADDPAVSYSYVEQIYRPALEAEFEALAGQTIEGDGFRQLAQVVADYNQDNQDGQSEKLQGTVVLKAGDVLTLETGTKITVQNGTFTANTTELVNVTDGASHSGALVAGKTYMMGGDRGTVTVTSVTGQAMVVGVCAVKGSDSVDYGSRAVALQTMGLFNGMDTGFALESGATRGQGLVMFLRVLGLEDEALAYKGTAPFTDVASTNWLYPYVAYAYESGLTTGISDTLFAPDSALTGQHYVTFMLRALGYDEGTEFDYATALSDAVSLGLYTSGEMALPNFYRYHMAYLSYEGLFGYDQSTGTLLILKLVEDGTVDAGNMYDGICQVSGSRVF